LAREINTAESKRILLVDDEPEITDSMKIGLEHEGFKVDTFNDPSAALVGFRRGRYSSVILDVRMEPINGPELCAMLKAIDPRPHYFLFSAFEPETIGNLSPGVPFLKKPISLHGLAERLSDLKVAAK
jgi:two-component system, OmpR family, response regulator ChvI